MPFNASELQNRYRPQGPDATLDLLDRAKEPDVGPLAEARDLCITKALACREVQWSNADGYAAQLSGPVWTNLAARSDDDARKMRAEFRTSVLDEIQAKTPGGPAQELVEAVEAFQKAIADAAFKATLPSALSGGMDDDAAIARAMRRVELTRSYQARGMQAANDAWDRLPEGVERQLLEEAIEVEAKQISRLGNQAMKTTMAPGGQTALRVGDVDAEIAAATALVNKISMARQQRTPEYVVAARGSFELILLATGKLVGQSVEYMRPMELGYQIFHSLTLPSPLRIQANWGVRALYDWSPALSGWTPLDANGKRTKPVVK
jgi:hypothetical protein